MLASLLFPYDDDAPALMPAWLDELAREHCIEQYQVEGASYIQIAKWLSHQKIDRPSPSKIPGPSEGSIVLAKPREESPLDQGPRTKDQGVDREVEPRAQKRAAAPSVEIARPDDVSESTWGDWLKLRKAKKAPVSETAVAGARGEAAKAGISLERFLQIWCTRGSQGLQADWLKPSERGFSAKPSAHSGFDKVDYRAGINDDFTFE